VGRYPLIVALLAAQSAWAQERGRARADIQVYAQPAANDFLLVITPRVDGDVAATKWLRFDVNALADVVTGATKRTYGPPDVVTAATRFNELRVSVGAGAAATAGPATISAGYQFGTENDYRSHLIRAGLKLDLLQHNTIITADYAHGFDSICDLDQSGVPILLRQPLDTSKACFSGVSGLTTEPLSIDTVEASLVQTITRSWLVGVVGSYQHLDGFQSNPYRRVRLSNGLYQAQESHPRLRNRGSLTLRVRHAFERWSASIGGDVRLYRDDWGIQSITGEASWEQPFHKARPEWRWQVRGRGYVQSGATFYRDAGRADSYDRMGPVGLYFTADQALAPLADLLLGARFIYANNRPSERRYWRMFSAVEASLLFNYVKIFALTPEPPNAERTRGFASALVFGASVTGKF
jgi:hypothetical protein